jgi:hypothetical protein
MMIVCKACKSPVYKHGSAYFHDVYPRSVATIAREVAEIDEQLQRSPGVVNRNTAETEERQKAA